MNGVALAVVARNPSDRSRSAGRSRISAAARRIADDAFHSLRSLRAVLADGVAEEDAVLGAGHLGGRVDHLLRHHAQFELCGEQTAHVADPIEQALAPLERRRDVRVAGVEHVVQQKRHALWRRQALERHHQGHRGGRQARLGCLLWLPRGAAVVPHSLSLSTACLGRYGRDDPGMGQRPPDRVRGSVSANHPTGSQLALQDEVRMSDKHNKHDLFERLNLTRRSFLKTTAAGGAALTAGGLVGLKTAKQARAFAYEPYPTDDQLQTVVTSCAHNCGSRHMLVAHKKGDVIVRISTDDGRFQRDGHFGKDTEAEPQLRGCLRGRCRGRLGRGRCLASYASVYATWCSPFSSSVTRVSRWSG